MIDFYLEYCTWFAQHYNRPFACSREQWNQWCRAAPAARQSDFDFDIETECREGYAYDNTL